MTAPGERPGQRHAERVRGGLDPAEVDDEAQVVMAVRALLAAPEGGGDIAAGQLALARGVLRCHRRVLAGPGQIRHGGRVAAGEDLRVAGHVQLRVDQQPAALDGQPERSAPAGRAARPHTRSASACR